VKAEGPEVLELRKPGQTIGHRFEQYHLLSHTESLGDDVSVRTKPPWVAGQAVFVSYSHKDREWLERLRRHLAPFVQQGSVTHWDDSLLEAGANWKDEIETALHAAQVAVLLVTPNYLASPFVAAHELKQILARARDHGVTIVWIAVSASAYAETDINQIQAANNPEQPLDSLPEWQQNQQLVEICKHIKSLLR